MKNLTKKDCCSGCQNGHLGKNASCQAKLMVEAMKKMKVERSQKLNTKGYEN